MNSTIRAWIFRILTLAGLGLILYTWFQPWWVAYIEALKENGVTIYPFAMVISGTLRDYPQWIVGAEMPKWFFPLMWVYLGVMVWALTFSLFVEGKTWPRLLVGFGGLAYIIFVVTCVVVISIRASQFYGTTLQGYVFISMNEHTESYVRTSLQTGYWLAAATGPFLVALALLRNKIVGNTEPSSELNPELSAG